MRRVLFLCSNCCAKLPASNNGCYPQALPPYGGTQARTGAALLPPDWPQPHPYAEDFDEFWVVHSLPPVPWPAGTDGVIDHQAYGPTGTEWLFNVGDYIDRLSMPLVHSALGAAAGALLQEAEAVKVPFGTTWGWRTPAGHDSPAGGDWTVDRMSIKVLRAVIHGKIGTLEEVAHVLHFRTDPQADVALTKADLDALAPNIQTAFKNFWGGQFSTSGNSPIGNLFRADLHYDEIRLAALTVTPGVRPVYDVPTQFYPFTAPPVGSGGAGALAAGRGLPNEVAACLSFNTHLRGARHRGRLYLGPLTGAILDGDTGMFSTAVEGLGKAFGDLFVSGVATSTGGLAGGQGLKLHVLSQKFGESYEVTGIRTGHVPDSQRRRRRSIPEAYAQVWGTAPGV